MGEEAKFDRQSALRILEANKEALTQSGFALINTLYDAQASFALMGSPCAEQDAAQNVADILLAYIESNPMLTGAAPRTLRPEDRIKLLPNQHKGFSLQFVLPGIGETLRTNVYGALREFGQGDLRDTDATLRNLHSSRTEAIMSQPTYINLHLKDIRENTLFDLWMTYQLNQRLRLDKLFLESEKIDFIPALTKEHAQFNQINSSLNAVIPTLARMIPSI